MATPFTSSLFSVFPTLADVNGGTVGDGQTASETKLRELTRKENRAAIVSGFVPPLTGAGLSRVMSGGTAVIDGYYIISIAGDSITYAASRTTRTFVQLVVTASAVQSAQWVTDTEVGGEGGDDPVTPINAMPLFDVVTDGTGITSVIDLRSYGRIVRGSVRWDATDSNWRMHWAGSGDWYPSGTSNTQYQVNFAPSLERVWPDRDPGSDPSFLVTGLAASADEVFSFEFLA